MSEIKLLPCPFCGGEAELIKRKSNFPYIHGVWCIGCNCRTSFEKSEEIAIEKWNNRNPVEDVLERLEEEKEALRTAKQKLSFEMYRSKEAYEKSVLLTEKELTLHEAIEIIKEVLMLEVEE